MALLIPILEVAKAAKQKPTEGEIFLLEFLERHFDHEVEVYFQPCFNGDRPDIVLLSPKLGVIIIEVKDWNLGLYNINKKNTWAVKLPTGLQQTKSPFAQVYAYKKNFFDIHVNGLLEKSLKDKAFFSMIKTYVYFHHGSKALVEELYEPHMDRLRAESRENDAAFKNKQIDFECYERRRKGIGQAKRKLERDKSFSLYKSNLTKINFPITANKSVFDESVYKEFRRLLNPPYHYAHEGEPLSYTERQAKLIESIPGARTKICGLAGSGKTVVLAGRAVNAHKRHASRVLVLTFNITLCSYIRDKISAVREGFNWSAFDIVNYHRFITTALNNSEVPVTIPDSLQYDGSNKKEARRIAIMRNQFLEKNFFSNLEVFENVEIKTKYETILIDEVQDYKPEWIKIIRSYFLEKGGEMLLFGDEKQNIYERELDSERRSKVVEGFGRWIKLTRSFRYVSESPIIPLVEAFQKHFLIHSYEIDTDESFQLSLASVGVQFYGIFSETNLEQLASQIIMTAKENGIHPNDITIISSQEEILRGLDYVLRTSVSHKERTLCTFPSHLFLLMRLQIIRNTP